MKKLFKNWSWPGLAACFAVLLLLTAAPAFAQDAAPATPAPVAEAAAAEPDPALQGAPDAAAFALYTANNVWMMLCTALVFIMHMGFATLESGLCQSKNTVNILSKNFFIIAIGILTYWVGGFSMMYPGFSMEGGNEFFALGTSWFYAPTAEQQTWAYVSGGYPGATDFLFQAMFAATCATIVSGAVAERVKLIPFFIFATLFVGLCYPILGSWKWGYGWLSDMGFHDFAGSTVVHSVGGWGALAGIMLLGPRKGKYNAEGKPHFLPMSNLPLATIGVFCLWLGWFGFNGGSVLSASPAGVSAVLLTTTLAAAAGTVLGLLTAWIVLKKADLSFMLNGCLAGLVGITASADIVSPAASLAIGAISGILVVFSVIMFDKLKLDDPVGATSVHLVCGIFGTLACGIFGGKNLGVQALGIVAYAVPAFAFAFVVFFILKMTIGIRVSEAEEAEGLDIGEHHQIAYDMPEKIG
jgi:Amt family ammonium transporter